jgi:hypothetical protein
MTVGMTPQHSNKANEAKPPASKAPVLWDRSRAHQASLARRIARLRRTGRP